MKLTSLEFLRSVRASYWFVPSVMLVLAIALGALMVWLDAGPAATMLDGVSWYQKSKPEGAREVLSTIAGSMITVAGVVFSITIVAISFAANQYGPRILTNFMSDRGNQVTLGTFVATFAYSVVVLRTIHAGETDFVPQMAVLVALVLALCSIAVLIYFIHHIPESIHINTVTARIGRQLIQAIEERFTNGEEAGSEIDETRDMLERTADSLFSLAAASTAIRSDSSGYLEVVDEAALAEIAGENYVVLRFDKVPGEFLRKGDVVARAAPKDLVSDETRVAVQRSCRVGRKRTPEQDLLFLADELVEIAARALSTGVNDPHTANTCVDWLSAAGSEMAGRRAPSPFLTERDGKLRVIVPRVTFGVFMNRSFGQLLPYVAADINAATHSLDALASLAGRCQSADNRTAVVEQIEALTISAKEQLSGPIRERLMRSTAAAYAVVQAPGD